MIKLGLQQKTKVVGGFVQCYWFENKKVGLERTLFTRIQLDLAKFDSGIEYESQPTETNLTVEWLELGSHSPGDLDGLEISTDRNPEMESTIYIGAAHNWCRILSMRFRNLGSSKIHVSGKMDIDFVTEGVAENESFEFECDLLHIGLAADA